MEQLLLIKSKVAKAFANIGVTNGTALPKSEDNTFSLIYEFFVASQLESAAKKRREAAKEACMSAGLLGEDYVPGMTKAVYDNDMLTVTAKTNQPAELLDKTALKNALVRQLGAEKA